MRTTDFIPWQPVYSLELLSIWQRTVLSAAQKSLTPYPNLFETKVEPSQKTLGSHVTSLPKVQHEFLWLQRRDKCIIYIEAILVGESSATPRRRYSPAVGERSVHDIQAIAPITKVGYEGLNMIHQNWYKSLVGTRACQRKN